MRITALAEFKRLIFCLQSLFSYSLLFSHSSDLPFRHFCSWSFVFQPRWVEKNVKRDFRPNANTWHLRHSPPLTTAPPLHHSIKMLQLLLRRVQLCGRHFVFGARWPDGRVRVYVFVFLFLHAKPSTVLIFDIFICTVLAFPVLCYSC